jgi:hypothetical protein
MEVSETWCTHKPSILMRVSIISHPFWGIPIFGHLQCEQIKVEVRAKSN